MSVEPIFIGGLLRCCIETLRGRTEPGVVDEVQSCTVGIGCAGRMVLHSDGWHRLPAAVQSEGNGS